MCITDIFFNTLCILSDIIAMEWLMSPYYVSYLKKYMYIHVLRFTNFFCAFVFVKSSIGTTNYLKITENYFFFFPFTNQCVPKFFEFRVGGITYRKKIIYTKNSTDLLEYYLGLFFFPYALTRNRRKQDLCYVKLDIIPIWSMNTLWYKVNICRRRLKIILCANSG